jgi:hypothetical protein
MAASEPPRYASPCIVLARGASAEAHDLWIAVISSDFARWDVQNPN